MAATHWPRWIWTRFLTTSVATSRPSYVQALVKELLLDNPNRVIAHIAPDPQYFEKMDAKITERLAKEGAL